MLLYAVEKFHPSFHATFIRSIIRHIPLLRLVFDSLLPLVLFLSIYLYSSINYALEYGETGNLSMGHIMVLRTSQRTKTFNFR